MKHLAPLMSLSFICALSLGGTAWTQTQLAPLPNVTVPKSTITETNAPEEVVTEETVTEEEFAANYVNYLAPPESLKLPTLISADDLKFASDVELAVALNTLNTAVLECTALRTRLEEQIGNRPGSYAVNTGWVASYQNCLKQRRADLNVIGRGLDRLQVRTIANPEEPASLENRKFITRMKARQSEIQLKLTKELRTQNKFVAYYNTGKREY